MQDDRKSIPGRAERIPQLVGMSCYEHLVMEVESGLNQSPHVHATGSWIRPTTRRQCECPEDSESTVGPALGLQTLPEIRHVHVFQTLGNGNLAFQDVLRTTSTLA